MKNIYLQIPLNPPEIDELVLATVTGTEGSTPQKPGSSALFNQAGLVSGTVGGGILEGKVQEISRQALYSKEPVLSHFMLDNSVSNGEDALCGGKISVLIDPLLSENIPVYKAIKESAEARIPGVLMTVVTKADDDRVLVSRYWIMETLREFIPEKLKPVVEPEIGSLLSGSDSYDFREIQLPENGDEPSRIIYLEPVIPPPRLFIAGAGHIGKALSQIGKMLGFEITVIDDRHEFANPENIPFANHIVVDDIGKAISRIDKSRDTFIVIVTRGHKDDGDALRACIGSDAAYIGMIGSKSKVALKRMEFIEKGWATPEQWDKIHAPVGVDIKSKTIEEIAVSIAAQLIQVKNEK